MPPMGSAAEVDESMSAGEIGTKSTVSVHGHHDLDPELLDIFLPALCQRQIGYVWMFLTDSLSHLYHFQLLGIFQSAYTWLCL
jgi:hypothetical protein